MKVQPITDLKDIKRIKRLLSSNPRNMLLFIMGINAGLRVQDILALRVSDVENAVVGDRITVLEKKTKKEKLEDSVKIAKSNLDDVKKVSDEKKADADAAKKELEEWS